MAVPCPRCGRDYDVALFQYGRTVHCTCGSRVALAPRVRALSGKGEVAFMVDAMLGRLAKWLRLIGCDVVFDPAIADADLARRALDEDRVVLTRDRTLTAEWSLPRILFVAPEALAEQLRLVVRTFEIDWQKGLFTRCSRCNVRLATVSDFAVIARRVPQRVREAHTQFFGCPACDRLYWSGSHVDRMERVLREALVP